ncbi:hypothetical protein SPRG_13932, partial [Saprolegnia parasitica CBS 223.65]
MQSMKFGHSIDAPSLVISALQRVFTTRISETKMTVSSMCAMVNDAKDLAPYLLDTIAPRFQMQLLELILEVRTVASKVLGMFVKGLGESYSLHLVLSLLQTIELESSSVEGSGSAQGLYDVLVNLGPSVLDHGLRDEIFPIARHPRPQLWCRRSLHV